MPLTKKTICTIVCHSLKKRDAPDSRAWLMKHWTPTLTVDNSIRTMKMMQSGYPISWLHPFLTTPNVNLQFMLCVGYQHHPSFLSNPLLNLQTVQNPLFRQPPYILFFFLWTPPPLSKKKKKKSHYELSSHILDFLNMYQHANSSIRSWEMTDFKMSQSDWPRVFWPLTRELELPHIWHSH